MTAKKTEEQMAIAAQAPKTAAQAEKKAAPVKKTAEKKTAVKAEPKKAAAKKAPAKKAPAKKPAAKKAEPKVNVVVEFYGRQIIAKDVVAACEAAYKAENKDAVKSIDVYVKPEDNAAYYVVNAKTSGKIDL